MAINKKYPVLRYSKFNNFDLRGLNPVITLESFEVQDSDAIEMSKELKSIGLEKFIVNEIQKQKDFMNHIEFDATQDELDLFFDAYINLLLTEISRFIDDDILLLQIHNTINSEESLLIKIDGEKLGLSGKHLDNYVKNKVAIINKERQEKAKADAKLLGTAMQQLLPEIFEDKRAIPNSFLRGALFGMVRKGRRALVGDMPIFTMSQYDLIFTGYELDQNDLELWDTLIYLAKVRKVDNELRISLYDLCQQMRLSYNQERAKKLEERALRLKTGVIKIKTDKKTFAGSLINNVYIDTAGDGKLVIEYNKKLTPLFTDNDYTLISADIRHLLGDNQLARWLYNFYESHNEPIPFSIDFLQKLCRSETEPKGFKRILKNSLETVKKAHLSVSIKSKWDYEITDGNYLLVYPNGKNKTKKQLDLFSKF